MILKILIGSPHSFRFASDLGVRPSASPIDGKGFADYTETMSSELQSQAGNLKRRAAQKRADRREDLRRLEQGAASPAVLQAENSALSSVSFSGAPIANLWESMGK